MGYLDDRVDQLQEGIDDLAAGDEIDRTNQLLAIIAASVSDQPDSYYQDGFEPTDPGESDSGPQTAQYSSVEGINTNDDPSVENWGFRADTIVLRNVDDDIVVAFKDPTQHTDADITVTPSDTPFVLSGVYGIRASKMWHQQGPDAAGSSTFDLLAVKRRGDN